jgi:GLPGLI family protein
MKKAGSKILLCLSGLFVSLQLSAQIVTEGRIVFERKTNLEKRFNDERMKRWLDGAKTKTDMFELIFNDSISIFRPVDSDIQDRMSWATNKNVILQDFNNNQKTIIFDISGQQVVVQDANDVRQWKITDSKRTIGKYRCRKAVYEKNDSTRLYAWYAVDIVPSVGPEGFFGLPGAILGLATEDGGIIYFATEVQMKPAKKEDFVLDLKKKDIYNPQELKAYLEKQFANQPWGQRLYDDLFRWL